jgi:hypothetical protein
VEKSKWVVECSLKQIDNFELTFFVFHCIFAFGIQRFPSSLHVQ